MNQLRLISRQVAVIGKALSRIAVALPRLADARTESSVVRLGSRQPAPAKKLRLSASRRAALKLQGQYMGHMRTLKPRQKARVKALRNTKGVPAAITLAKRLART